MTEWVGKPLVDRRIDGVHTSFPSGHVTTAAAIAALLWFSWRRRHRLSSVPVAVYSVWILPAAVGIAVVRLRWHVATDVLGGISVGCGIVFLVYAVFVRLENSRANRPRRIPPIGDKGMKNVTPCLL